MDDENRKKGKENNFPRLEGSGRVGGDRVVCRLLKKMGLLHLSKIRNGCVQCPNCEKKYQNLSVLLITLPGTSAFSPPFPFFLYPLPEKAFQLGGVY